MYHLTKPKTVLELYKYYYTDFCSRPTSDVSDLLLFVFPKLRKEHFTTPRKHETGVEAFVTMT